MSERILAYSTVLRAMRRQHFAVLSTIDTAGHPASAGVTYGLTQSGAAMYVMTRRHLQKVRNIAVNAAASLAIPVPRRLLCGSTAILPFPAHLRGTWRAALFVGMDSTPQPGAYTQSPHLDGWRNPVELRAVAPLSQSDPKPVTI